MQKETGVLEKEQALQTILKKMLAVQEDKVAKLKELIADHHEKEISIVEAVDQLNQQIGEGKKEIENHLDSLKNIAEKVRSDEIAKINRFTDTFMDAGRSLPESGEQAAEAELEKYKKEDGSEVDFLSEIVGPDRPIKSADKIKSMRRIKSMKKIKSITVSDFIILIKTGMTSWRIVPTSFIFGCVIQFS